MNLHTGKKARRKLTSAVLAAALLVSGLPLTAYAGDTWPFTGDSAPGANQPNVHGYTSSHIANWSPATDPDAELLRSRVPLQKRNAPFAATQANPALSADTQMINVAGDYGNAFIENAPYTNKFAQYHFNFWQYIDYYSYWHGTATAYTPPEYYDELAQKDWQQKWFEFGMLNIPNPTYTDAAHKNGVLSLAGIFFSNNDRGQQTYKQMIVKDENGNFPVADKLIEMAGYFGFDGYFVNQEEMNPNVATQDIPDYIGFMKVLQEGGLYVQWYDSLNTNTGANTFARTINDTNISFLVDKSTKEPVSNSFFFDYGAGNTQITNAANYLSNLNASLGTSYNLFDVGFAGLEAGRDRFKSVNGTALMNKLDSNGLPRLSLATLGADFVHAGLDEDMNLSYPVSHRSENDYQWMTKLREQLWWSGPNVDPKNTVKSATNTVSDVYADNRYWPGISSVIAERSVIKDKNFYTNFNTGQGLSYSVNGEISNPDEWSNMSLQDIPVTWQWWQDTAGNKLTVDFDYGPEYNLAGTNRYNYEQIGAYNGGSSLVVNGNLNAKNFLRLYKTELEVNGNSKLSISFNKPSATDASAMAVGLILADDPNTVVEVAIPNSGQHSEGWVTKELDLSAYAGHNIVALGLVFDPGQGTASTYQMNVGQLRVYDGSAVKPAAPAELTVAEAFTDTGEMVVKWKLDPDYTKIKQYNVYVNDVFMGGKYDEVFYLKHLPVKSGTLKVVAVGADGVEGEAASLAFDLDAAVSGVKVDSSADGELTVNWTNSAQASGDITVRVQSLNWITTSEPVSQQVVVPAGASTALFTGMPVNGDDYIVTITAGNTDPVSVSGRFIDTVAEPYAEEWSWTDGKLNLPMPNTRDWRYMYVYEDGNPKSFATTYSSGNKPMIIRGRTTKASLSFTSTAKVVHVVMEDYAGNRSKPVYLKGSYPVLFDANGGEPANTVAEAVYGTLLLEPTGIAREGYDLEGWYVGEGEGARRWNFAEDLITGELNLQAKWALQAPKVQIVGEGSFRENTSATLTAVATGAGQLTYAWYADTGSGYGDALGMSASYTIPALTTGMDGNKYKVIVINESGDSSEAEYTLNVTPAEAPWEAPDFITDLPSALDVIAGEEVKLFVQIRGDVESVRWETKAATAEEWTVAESVTSTVYAFTASEADSGTQFRVVLTGKEGTEPSTRTGNELTVTVHPAPDAPIITAYSVDKNPAAVGDKVSFAVVASAVYGELSYQWLKNGQAVEGAVERDYTIASAKETDSGEYTAVVTNTKILNGRPYTAVQKSGIIDLEVHNTPVSTPQPTSAPGTGTGTGGTTPAATATPLPSPTSATLTVPASALSTSTENGKVTVNVPAGVTAIELPVNAGELLGIRQLELAASGTTLGIAPELLVQLKALLNEAQASGSKIQVKLSPETLNMSTLKAERGVVLRGTGMTFDLSIIAGNGTSNRLPSFSKPVTIQWSAANTDYNTNLLGLYAIAEGGSLTYLGGVYANGFLLGEFSGTGRLAVLEYNKSFADVPSTHWAADTIRQLAAKHLIQGTSENGFEPARSITRAEFVKLLAGVLGLQAQAELKFSDVPSGVWYEQDLARLVRAGIVGGRTAEHFDPSANISRQEIVTMLMRAYVLEHGALQSSAPATFTDSGEVAAWAADSVNAASSLGLVNGRTDGNFVPGGLATRAEAAQFILNYIR